MISYFFFDLPGRVDHCLDLRHNGDVDRLAGALGSFARGEADPAIFDLAFLKHANVNRLLPAEIGQAVDAAEHWAALRRDGSAGVAARLGLHSHSRISCTCS